MELYSESIPNGRPMEIGGSRKISDRLSEIAKSSFVGRKNEIAILSNAVEAIAPPFVVAFIRFQDSGTHILKGIPGEWRLFAVEREHNSSREQKRSKKTVKKLSVFYLNSSKI